MSDRHAGTADAAPTAGEARDAMVTIVKGGWKQPEELPDPSSMVQGSVVIAGGGRAYRVDSLRWLPADVFSESEFTEVATEFVKAERARALRDAQDSLAVRCGLIAGFLVGAVIVVSAPATFNEIYSLFGLASGSIFFALALWIMLAVTLAAGAGLAVRHLFSSRAGIDKTLVLPRRAELEQAIVLPDDEYQRLPVEHTPRVSIVELRSQGDRATFIEGPRIGRSVASRRDEASDIDDRRRAL